MDLSWFTGAVWFLTVVVVMGGLLACLVVTCPKPHIYDDEQEVPR